MASEPDRNGPIRISEQFSDTLVVTLAPLKPPMLPEEWKQTLLDASNDLLEAMSDPAFRPWLEKATPDTVSIIPLSSSVDANAEEAAKVGSDTKWPMTVSIDFALTVDPETGRTKPQLIELQAFPTVGIVTLSKFWLYYSRATSPILEATEPSILKARYRPVVEVPNQTEPVTELEEAIFRKLFFQSQADNSPQTAEGLFEKFLWQIAASVGGLRPLHGLRENLTLMASEPWRLPQEGVVDEIFHAESYSQHGTILVEIQPDQQKTFLEMQLLSYTFGMPIVCISRLLKQSSGKLVWMDRHGKEWPIKKIYSRVVPTELIHKMKAGFECKVPFAVERVAQESSCGKVSLEPLEVPVLNHPAWYMQISKHSMPFLHQRAPQWVPRCEFLSPNALRRWTDELGKDTSTSVEVRLSGKVVKPLFELGGAGVMMEPTLTEVEALLAESPADSATPIHLLMDRVEYTPIVPCSDGRPAKAEIRVLCYGDGTAMPKPIFCLARLSRDEKVNNVRVGGPETQRNDLPVYSGSAPLFFH